MGVLRILLLAVSAISKLFGRKGDFYRVAGYKASSIDLTHQKHIALIINMWF